MACDSFFCIILWRCQFFCISLAEECQANHSWLRDIIWQKQELRLTQCTLVVLAVTRSTCVMASR